ncbi:hypothetical protein [Streptomyces pseudogriseolus]|uniref:hypothetical protein n=1 Tax=Streptomyces pseudogriseolus TaxID=36817 RepID=UPI003FA26679
MRLRQAHAMFDAVSAVEALRLHFHFETTDTPTGLHPDDSLIGHTEIDPEQRPGYDRYELRLTPGPGEFDVTVRLAVSDDTDVDRVLHHDEVTVWHPDNGTLLAHGGFAHNVARVVEDAVYGHSWPTKAAARA